MWGFLRSRRFRGLKFSRQHPVDPFIVDFLCRELMLVVELDGSQHADSAYDEQRTAYLNAHGYSVLRFWNNELGNLDSVWRLLSAVVDGSYTDLPLGWRYSPATSSAEGLGNLTATPVKD